jgi:ABC-type transport system involved in multi-copper enzyme maturation permease subunit
MNITLTIMVYSLKDYLNSLRLLIGFIIVIFLMVSGAFIYSQRYQQEVLEYSGNLIDLNTRIAEASSSLASVATMTREAYRQPSLLQFVVDGGEETLPNKIPFTVNLMMSPDREGGVNYMLPPFEGVDWDFIVRVILSFVAIVLTYDAVSGERERGTLRLIMANPVPRDKFIWGKFLAALIALTAPLLLGTLMSIAVVIGYGGISLGMQDVVRFMVHLLMSSTYLAIFILLGLIVSVLVKKSSSSLVILLLIWVCLVIAVPGMARPISVITGDIQSRKDFYDRISRILDDTIREYEGQDVSHAPLEVAPIDDSEYRWAEMMDKVDAREQEMVDHYWAEKVKQARFARSITAVSPAGLYRFAGQDLINTGLKRQENFIQSVNTFRGILADFAREVDAGDQNSPHILYREWYMSREPIDPDIVPKYRDSLYGGGRGMSEGLRGEMWLLVEALILFVLAHVCFLRSDVR